MYEYLKYFELNIYKSSLCLKTVYCSDSHPEKFPILVIWQIKIPIAFHHTHIYGVFRYNFLILGTRVPKCEESLVYCISKIKNWHLFCFRVKWKVSKNHSTILRTQWGKLKRIHYPWTFFENVFKTNELWPYLIPVPFNLS
jgi:hypothetical protein